MSELDELVSLKPFVFQPSGTISQCRGVKYMGLRDLIFPLTHGTPSYDTVVTLIHDIYKGR